MTQIGIIPTGNAPLVCVPQVEKPRCQVRQWELVEFAGSGSLARIHRARPAGSPGDRPANYAVKMLRLCWQDDTRAIRLLQREALVGQSVSHPHLVPVLSAAVIEPPRLLVMPWLTGASLDARLARGQTFTVPEALWIVRQTAEALDALHTAGWTHGDVTPGNIYISPTGHVTLIDLSFARRRDEIGSAVDRPIMGTCRYIAPEYLTSALQPDIRSDIYSLGAVLFQLLSGHMPFEGEDLAELATQHKQAAPLDLAQFAPSTPREVIQLVRAMIAKEPLRRPQTPGELVDLLVSLEVGTFSQRGW